MRRKDIDSRGFQAGICAGVSGRRWGQNAMESDRRRDAGRDRALTEAQRTLQSVGARSQNHGQSAPNGASNRAKVAVTQLDKSTVVDCGVMGSSPVRHPLENQKPSRGDMASKEPAADSAIKKFLEDWRKKQKPANKLRADADAAEEAAAKAASDLAGELIANHKSAKVTLDDVEYVPKASPIRKKRGSDEPITPKYPFQLVRASSRETLEM